MKTCNSCERYVHDHDQTCPFCSSNEFNGEPTSPSVGRGVSRARVYAARAAIAGAAFTVTTACSDDEQNDTTTQTGGQASSGGNQASGGAQSASGGGFELGGRFELGGGAENEGGLGGDVGVPIYGGPFPDMMKARV